MSSSGCYGDTIEDYIRDTIEVVVPEYEMWRPYFEFDVQSIIENYTGFRKKAQYKAREQIGLLLERFIDEDLPIWVREKVLERIALFIDTGHEAIFNHFMQSLLERMESDMSVSYRVRALALQSELVRTIFEGVEL